MLQGIRLIEGRKVDGDKETHAKAVFRQVEISDDCLNAIDHLEKGQWLYICLKDRDWDKICVIVNRMLSKNKLPGFVFSYKDDREAFFQRLYGGTINSMPASCMANGKYVVREDGNIKDAAWNGRDAKRTIKFSELQDIQKVFIESKLISHWTESNAEKSHIAPNPDILFFVKTVSREAGNVPFAGYYDYEDRYIENRFSSPPCVIFVFDRSSLPRPEKVFYDKHKIICLVKDLPIINRSMISEHDLGLPKIELANFNVGFFDALAHYEKARFSSLLIKLVLCKFTDPGEIRVPDEFERDYFSRKLENRNRLTEAFSIIRASLIKYSGKNWTDLEKNFKDRTDVIFDLTVEKISNPGPEMKYFVPNVFNQILRFIFAKDLFYSEIGALDYDALKKEILKIAETFAVNVKEPEMATLDEEDEYNDKVDMEEQYSEDRLKEIDCKRITFRRETKQLFMFVPVSSKASIDHVERSGQKLHLRYTDLQIGDTFEKDYWNYSKLVEEFNKRPEIIKNDKMLEESLKISSEFREILRGYLSSRARAIMMNEVKNKLESMLGKDRSVNYLTIASWIDTIMCPIEDSIPTITAIIELSKSRSELFEDVDIKYNYSAKNFIDACRYIKSKRGEFGERVSEEERKITLIVEKVETGPFRVRGENVGRICAVA